MKDKIQAYLKTKNETARVIKATTLAGGSSTETVLVDLTWINDGKEETIGQVYKIHQETGAVGAAADQVKEFNVLKCLMGTDVTAPKVYWVEEDEKWLGAPFFVMEKLTGSASTSEIMKNEAVRVSISRQLVEQMAKIHLLDLEKTGLSSIGVPKTDEDCALDQIKQWEPLYRGYAVFPDPAVEAVLDWLKENAPKDVARKSLVWGDPGPGNFMHDNVKITGLLDWELAHIGDPMEDVALLLNKLLTSAKMMSTEELLKFYEEYSGIKINRRNVLYYRVLWHFKMSMIAIHCLREFHTGSTASVFTGYSGALFTPLEMIKAFNLIQEEEGGEFYAAI